MRRDDFSLFPCTLRRTPTRRFSDSLLLLALAAALLTGCHARRRATYALADALSSSTSTIGSDDDPALVLDAIPFALLSLESVAEAAPEHVPIRATLAMSFTQFAYAGSSHPAELVKFEDYSRYQALHAQATRRYLRGKRWGLEGLELRHPGLASELAADPPTACGRLTGDELDLIYWTGAAWLAAISQSLSQVDLLAELPQASALLDRAYALDPDYDRGGLHELLLALAMSRPESQGGGEANALKHYARALELSRGQRASVYVGFATSIAVKKQDHVAFVDALEKALAIPARQVPEGRLANLLAQERARYLLTHAGDLFDLPIPDESLDLDDDE